MNRHLRLLCHWEVNGYHDSYFYCGYWNVETQQVKTEEIGSTAYASGSSRDATPYPSWTIAEVEQFRQHFEAFIFQSLRKAEHKDVLQPEKVEPGESVRLVEAIQANKPYQAVSCSRCKGTGFWQNPKDTNDKRSCFNCHGLKWIVGEPLSQKVKFHCGTIGVVIWVGSFRKIYRNGYNTLGRKTLSTRLMVDQTIINAPLEKLRLDREPESDASLLERAKRLSYQFQIAPLVGCRSWLSDLHIPEALQHELKSQYEQQKLATHP
ncbi:hypothetical protein ACQ4M3_13440 [Leptolyngbya sp. AN03gr2]|uniref:hypothetical protein n=1 Tax=unclassified Leptolyngbya TaxID=2650499 RepID=UPI003D32231E